MRRGLADGDRLAYTSGKELYVAKGDGTEPRRLVSLAGVVSWPRWSPDGTRLRFTLNGQNGSGIWEVAPDGSGPPSGAGRLERHTGGVLRELDAGRKVFRFPVVPRWGREYLGDARSREPVSASEPRARRS